MRDRRCWKWILGVSLTTVALTAASLQTAVSEPVSNDDAGQPSSSKGQSTPAEASTNQVSALADTDAPAKLVSSDKPLPPTIRATGPVAEVIKLANSGLDESVMLAFVTNSQHTFNLGAEEIIYLNDIGVPGSIVTAMIQRDQIIKGELATAATPPMAPAEAPGASAVPDSSSQFSVTSPSPDQVAPQPMEAPPYAAEAPLTPPDEAAGDMFYDSLAPYGNWVDVEGYGRCWQPTVAVINGGWQPYFDSGHWIYSDCGWYWCSDYSWGWAPFHYGCWFRHGGLGWCWVPGHTWGPSWVCWRYNGDYCGWAPLPPGAVFTAGIGLTFHGHHVGERDDLGLRADHYHFVAWNHFQDRQLRPHSLPPQQVASVYAASTITTRITGDSRTVINNGLPPSRVAAATHRPVQKVALRELTDPMPVGTRAEGLDPGGRSLTVYRPTPALASRGSTANIGSGYRGALGSSSGRFAAPAATPSAPRTGAGRRSSNDLNQESQRAASAPLILRGQQSSALRESAPPNSLVVVGGANDTRPSNVALPPGRPGQNPADRDPRSATSDPVANVNPSPRTVSRPAVTQYPYSQRNWMGSVSSSPQPSWFAGSEASSTRQFNRAAVPRPETPTYQAVPRMPAAEVPRYAPAPTYAPQRSYSAGPAWSAPARSGPSFESRPAPAAPPAPPAPSAPSHSSSSSQPSSRNGR